jgi:general secretion pathway protein L
VRPELERTLDRAYAALNWWLEGLWLGLPARARTSLFAERTELVVRFIGDTAIVGARDAKPVTIDMTDANPPAAIAQLVPAAEAPDVTALLPHGAVLTHTLHLPAAVESELHRVLEHELDRLTPFEAGDIVFDYRIRERNDRTLGVDVALARRAALDEVIAKLEALGLRATAATAEDAHGMPLPLNLLARRRRLRLPAARLSLRPAFGISAALLLIAALYLPLSRYDRALAAQAATVEAARAEAVAARGRLAEQEAALASGELLAERRGAYVPPIVLLRELTAEIPEHTWLSRFAISRGEVYLQGESAAATELLQLLESTELLRDVQFQSPVARSDESGKEQFTIVAKLARFAP